MCQTRLKQATVESEFQQLKSELEVYLNHLKVLVSKEFENVSAKFSIDEVCNSIPILFYHLLIQNVPSPGEMERVLHRTGLINIRPKQGT